jgi:hypothetical protein
VRKLRVFRLDKPLIGADAAVGSQTLAARPQTASTRARVPHGVTCADCYFRERGLCALVLEHPCPTFRAAGRALAPPYQARLVPRPLGAAAA